MLSWLCEDDIKTAAVTSLHSSSSSSNYNQVGCTPDLQGDADGRQPPLVRNLRMITDS